ncbi:hypothetical protein ASPACDRAFT_110701 [Aspergillus aculeatus ATCC 16872]|uniref:Uncharacterized protein n=1 Tax=Aspergillus aculeatus (strain ATCC 16872 / CBS 172.66 / WB 5094) TaxID=690307 RepID=A0A1L9XA39_ASPA1|nr:uncharacterized protein ASPACDRAFT_110701 [Aspergillus aculeatus ATCC 16872]OJK05290.1 hypothetical protein ASPACDRAFT_110701 [Aspergillus aculeatus ATCC 16872]
MTSAVIADSLWPRKIVVRAVGARAHLTYLELLRACTSIVPDFSILQLRLGIASALDLMIIDIETVQARGSTWFTESKFCILCGSGSHRIASHRGRTACAMWAFPYIAFLNSGSSGSNTAHGPHPDFPTRRSISGLLSLYQNRRDQIPTKFAYLSQ